MFDVTKFIDRKNWTIAELANRLFDRGGVSRVGMWKTGDSNPRYAEIIKLIELGASAEELFGKEHSDLLLKNSEATPEVSSTIFDSPKFRAEIEKILLEINSSSKNR